MLFYIFRKNIIHNGWLALCSFIVLALTIKTPYFSYCLATFGSYVIFYLAFQKKLRFNNFGKHGDFSYGMYIYAFLVQQMVAYTSNNHLSTLENFLVAFAITLMFAIVSWHLVEKNALKLKKVSIINRKKSSNNIKDRNVSS
jgi:peptidoglycan/LPS O-acetylase OafA/YrhL